MLNIVYKDEDNAWHFNAHTDRITALLILDQNLSRNKKWVNPEIIPDTGKLISVLGDISEKLTIGISQNNIALNRSKTALNRKGENLFSKDEQRRRDRIHIAGEIARSIYASGIYVDSATHEEINNLIVKATDDLLNKLDQ